MKTENSLIKDLLINANDARRFYLKFDVIDKIISLFTYNEKQSNNGKWEKLISLQKRINNVKHELGSEEADALMREVIETLNEYLNKNSSFREEASENFKLFSNIQKEKAASLEQIFMIKEDE